MMELVAILSANWPMLVLVHQHSKKKLTKAAHKFCSKIMPRTTFFHPEKPDVHKIRILLQDRYNLGQTVTGTKSFHFFSSLNVGRV